MSPAVYQWAALNELQAIFGMQLIELSKFGIDGTVNAASYFALNQ